MPQQQQNRRNFLSQIGGLAAASGLVGLNPQASANTDPQQGLAETRPPSSAPPPRFCAFIKFIQQLKPRDMANALREAGFDGAEVTVRPGGYVTPENAADRLPAIDEAFRDTGLSIDIITTSITRVDSPHAEAILRSAAVLKVPYYRMGFCRYDLKKPIRPQIEAFAPQFQELAQWNRELGIRGFYQNHSGAGYLGATIWDLAKILDDLPGKDLGVIFDIRHACVEAGLAWPIYYDIIKPHIRALSIKDFKWEKRRAENVPLGEGQIDPAFFSHATTDFPSAQYTVHVEYLEQADWQPNLEALRKDLKQLRQFLAQANADG